MAKRRIGVGWDRTIQNALRGGHSVDHLVMKWAERAWASIREEALDHPMCAERHVNAIYIALWKALEPCKEAIQLHQEDCDEKIADLRHKLKLSKESRRKLESQVEYLKKRVTNDRAKQKRS